MKQYESEITEGIRVVTIHGKRRPECAFGQIQSGTSGRGLPYGGEEVLVYLTVAESLWNVQTKS